jgi:hypothetical protein
VASWTVFSRPWCGIRLFFFRVFLVVTLHLMVLLLLLLLLVIIDHCGGGDGDGRCGAASH